MRSDFVAAVHHDGVPSGVTRPDFASSFPELAWIHWTHWSFAVATNVSAARDGAAVGSGPPLHRGRPRSRLDPDPATPCPTYRRHPAAAPPHHRSCHSPPTVTRDSTLAALQCMSQTLDPIHATVLPLQAGGRGVSPNAVSRPPVPVTCPSRGAISTPVADVLPRAADSPHIRGSRPRTGFPLLVLRLPFPASGLPTIRPIPHSPTHNLPF